MRISGWSSDVCSSDLESVRSPCCEIRGVHPSHPLQYSSGRHLARSAGSASAPRRPPPTTTPALHHTLPLTRTTTTPSLRHGPPSPLSPPSRSEEHTSELQSLMRISYAVFRLKKKKK